MPASRTWFSVIITMPPSDVEIAAAELYELGCNGILEELADDSGRVRLTASFDADASRSEGLVAAVRASFASLPSLAAAPIEVHKEESGDWSERWRQHFAPFAIAPDIIVAPSWEQYQARPGEQVIEIDPGMAFGTGLHPTTRLCASILASILRNDDAPASPTLLDIGTGSAILAILGRKLGCSSIAAVDIDPDALRVAEENLAKNGCPDVRLAEGLSAFDGTFDIVVANILLGTLVELREQIARRVAAGGWLVLSGITHDQEAEIAAVYAPDFHEASIARDGEWSAIACRRRR